jgi:predicted TIM-barrel fold metal-dependent hydrolase
MHPFVDSHIHFWDRRQSLAYDFLDDDSPHHIIGDIDGVRVLRFGPAEFEAQSRFQNVEKVIHVTVSSERRDLVAETRWLNSLKETTGYPNAIIARVDLSADDVQLQLDRQAEFGMLRGLRGVRDTGEMSTTKWRRGYSALEDMGLVFCHPFGHDESPAALALADDFPGIILCIDQAGLPAARDVSYFTLWREGIRRMAGPSNTVCKISSLGMRDQRWTVESLRPWVETCLEAFGPQRCFFGSNWPMDSLFSNYTDLINAYRVLVSPYTEGEQRDVLSRNADRIFRL